MFLDASQGSCWPKTEERGEKHQEKPVKSYQEFMKERSAELREEQGLSQPEAMKIVGVEWKQYKQAQGEERALPDTQEKPRQRKRGRPRKQKEEGVKESKLRGLQSLKSLRLEVPYLVEAEPDVSAAWDVAEGIVDFLMENAVGVDEADAFQRRAMAAYMRAKGGTSQGDQTEYELGRSLGETLLLVMAYRGMTQLQWQAMSPPQLAEGEFIVEGEPEEKGLIDSGLEMLGLKDSESTSSKAVKKVKEKAMDKTIDVVGQTVLDLLQ